tara:strand:- start:62 stop:580 length:519 start_codon:yes stop_codon:yes gene_type:complete
MTALFLYTVVMRFGILIIILFLTGCATTYTPEQLQARAEDKTDYQLCYGMARVQWFGDPVSKYTVGELNRRQVNCMDHYDDIIEARQKQIMLGQALIAFGNTVKSNQPQVAPITLPNYGNQSVQPMTSKVGFLKSDRTVISGFNKVCYYDVLGSIYTLNINASGICPITHNF